jgi:hypothetical protein
MFGLTPIIDSTYTLTAEPDVVLRDVDSAFVPFDPANRDYQGYLAWLADGNEPSPYEPPEVLSS